MTTGQLLIYGANGYTGELCARFARDQGLAPILAGRSASTVEAVATRYGMDRRVFALEPAGDVDAGLEGIAVVLHCAGPFSRTSRPIADACLRRGVHYLDVTGEVAVFEALSARDEEAKRASVMLLPGTGFDVVPSDCLAAHLAERLPDASDLTLAFMGVGGAVSHGTATTMVENLGKSSLVRKDGELTDVVMGSLTRDVDFGEGPRHCMSIPWGDVSTAFHSTGIPNISVYTAVPRAASLAARVTSRFARVLSPAPLQRFLQRRIDALPAGPTDARRARGYSLLFGEARNARDDVARARLRTPEGYTLTALASLLVARRVLAGDVKPGFQTPASAYGSGLVLEIPGVERTEA